MLSPLVYSPEAARAAAELMAALGLGLVVAALLHHEFPHNVAGGGGRRHDERERCGHATTPVRSASSSGLEHPASAARLSGMWALFATGAQLGVAAVLLVLAALVVIGGARSLLRGVFFGGFGGFGAPYEDDDFNPSDAEGLRALDAGEDQEASKTPAGGGRASRT